MHIFLANNRDELVARCKAKVALRPRRLATQEQISSGVPMFLGQLMKTLLAEEDGRSDDSLRISGPSGGGHAMLSEIGMSATAHGKDLLSLGYTVDQVVHDYGDLCQAITDLAVERDAPFTLDEFRTLNRCLDNAIADAVTSFSAERDEHFADRQHSEENERLGGLVHELRNALHPAVLAFAALESGDLPIGGSTGAVLKRSLASLSSMLAEAMNEVKASANRSRATEVIFIASFIDEAAKAAELMASVSGSILTVPTVVPGLAVQGDRALLFAALFNLLHNAFKFTHAGTEVVMRAYADAASNRLNIDVSDHCGGLAHGVESKMFVPFAHSNPDRFGLGLGLSIARASVEADGGTLTVRDMPGQGCVFTISLPRYKAA
ncbi:hypothetical protein BH09PSE5_BH09PSE5_04020 [soil metagenome]